MTMSEKQIGEADAVDEDVSDDAAWVRSFLQILNEELLGNPFNYESPSFNPSITFALRSGPPPKFGSLDTPEPDGDRGGDPGPDVDGGDDGIGVVDSDQRGVVGVGEGGGDQQQEGDQQTHVSTNRTKS